MFNAILRFSIYHRWMVLILTVAVVAYGVTNYKNLTIDAVPDISNVQVQVNTHAPGYSPLEVEQRITVPVELLLSGIPSLAYTRSLSRYGLSQVTVVFRDGTDIHFARQLVSQKLQEAQEKLPPNLAPTLGPIATGLGEIVMFTVENSPTAKQRRSLQELREIQDWIVKPQLRTVAGVAEVNTIGGESKQYVVTPNLDRLRAYSLTLDDLMLALAKSNSNVGAGYIEQNGQQYLVRVPAQLLSLTQIEQVVVGVHEGIPVFVSDIASVRMGSELRTGAATKNGQEVVLGTVVMLMGENGRDVSHRVVEMLSEVSQSLPSGVITNIVYNRASLVDQTMATVRKNLVEGAVLVIVILFLVLGNFKAALLTACVIPISMLMTISGMVQVKLSANLMSLGALDFGLIVDGAVILIENCVRRLAQERQKLGRMLSLNERLETIFDASSEVRQATMFGELIIMVVYIPILSLSGIEGKMYHPMATTVLLALGAAFLLSLTFVPASVAIFIGGNIHHSEEGWFTRVQRIYNKILVGVSAYPYIVVGMTLAALLFSFVLFSRLGAEFIPSLDEGDVALHALRIPGTSLSQSIQMQHQLEEKIMQVPEVSHFFSKIGTAEIATDPMPPSIADGFIILKPRSNWINPDKPKSEVIADIEQIATTLPGNNYEFTQPIQMRFNELIAGVRSDFAVKLFGDDMSTLLAYAKQVKDILVALPGATDVKVEQVSGLPTISVMPNRERLSRLGLNVSELQNVVQTAIAGQAVGEMFEGDRRFPLIVRLAEEDRQRLSSLYDIPIALPFSVEASKELIPNGRTTIKTENRERSYVNLNDVAEMSVVEGPNQISRENGKRRIVVTSNIRGRDLGSFVTTAQTAINKQVPLPPGYWLTWGGQYEHLLTARTRLAIVVPIVLLTIFFLIFATFNSLRDTFLVFTGIPFSLTGGVIGLWVRGIPFSISAAIGFIALSGVAVLNGLVMVSFITRSLSNGLEVRVAVIDGALTRLRPVLMTALVASLGFVPMAMSQGTGSEVQRPLATVVIGGIVSSTVLTLIVLPALFMLLHRQKDK